MRKKLLLVAVMLTAFWGKSFACGWDDGDWYYYNLFSQELMNDPVYRPFLLTYESKYYTDDIIRNGNIAEWQKYLGLSYEDTQYLVFESSRDDLQNLTKGKAAADSRLAFATPEFVKKHKQALLYLAYAKYLEPYMRVIPDTDSEVYFWWWDEKYEHNAGDLDYNKVKTVLTKSWNAESDDELKLRYGYQLVRLAHYSRKYQEAIDLFDQYVKPLNMRTEMYYYALSQKAGALRGMGQIEKANREFIHVFTNSIDLKTSAYTSMTFGEENDINFADFVAGAADDKERNDIYFMMGYSDFNNPVNEIEKIVANDPNAIQARVLMVRTVNLVERALLTTHLDADDNEALYPSWKASNVETMRFFEQAIRLSDKQRENAADKNFWNLTSSYLHFLNNDFDKASTYLANVKSKDELYMTMVGNLTAFIDICRQPTIDAEAERNLYAKYSSLIEGEIGGNFNMAYNSFVGNVLTNRYARQGENAKSYLVLNHLKELENAPNEKLLDEIQTFLNKKKKTPMEQYFADKGTMELGNYNNYIAYFKGVLRLTEGNFKEAKKQFDKQTRLIVSKRIFGHNIMVNYGLVDNFIMRDDYISEFPFIHDDMTEADVADALMQLQKIGDKKGDEAAKANYLIANFYYNVSVTGYYRHYLRFDDDNSFSYYKYGNYGDEPYKNTLQLSSTYLEKAMKTATDNELKAHIVFAQAKNAQQVMEGEDFSTWDYTMVIPHAWFYELDKYRGTAYQKEVLSNCVYYSDYHN
ncbi:MAG: hypothetical protein J6P83_07400 [Bacteroidales bacterium]|nr:hypothetical protein [Bacteroidales bacterium]